MRKFIRGEVFSERGAQYITYCIDEGEHISKIEVHGDNLLRNLIVDLLNDYFWNEHQKEVENETIRKIRSNKRVS